MGRIVTIIGNGPEIIKMAPVVKALDGLSHDHVLVHSGQHYDLVMDRIFFRDMELREPDYQFALKNQPAPLHVATTMRHVAQVAGTADLVMVHGDTNTTVAGAMLANKLGKRVGHVEAGIRSFDKTMSEEVNRIVADQLASLLFAPTRIARENLRKENVQDGGHVVGNSAIDALKANSAIAERRSNILDRLGLSRGGDFLSHFQLDDKVDETTQSVPALKAFETAAKVAGLPVVFPIHPRTATKLRAFGPAKSAHPMKGLRR